MPITLAQLGAKQADYTVAFEDGTSLSGKFYPDRVTSKLVRQMQSLSTLDTGNADEVFNGVDEFDTALLKLLAPDTWDLWDTLDANNQPIPEGTTDPTTGAPIPASKRLPTTVETLSDLGIPTKVAIFLAIIEASNQGKTAGTTPNAG